jgi:ubiquinone/menaquinone biosynthesis C-methylase UbiE
MNNIAHYESTIRYHQQKAIFANGYYDAKPGGKSRHSIWTNLTRKNVLNILSEVTKSHPNIKSLVTLGCGRGDFTIEIAEKFPFIAKIEGVDCVTESLQIAEKESAHLSQVKFRKGNLLNLPYSDKSFDVSLCINVFHHIHEDDHYIVLKEISRITKHHLIIEIKNNNNFYYRYVNPKTFGGIKVYPTTSKRVKKSLLPHGFQLNRKIGIFYWEWLSPIVRLHFSNRNLKKYLGFCLMNFFEYFS